MAAFNFGIPAAGPVTNLINVRRLLSAADRPDLLVLEVMPPLFAMTPAGAAEAKYLAAHRLRDDELNIAVAHGFPREQAHPWHADRFVPCYRLRFPVLGRLAGSWLPPMLRCGASRMADDSGWLRPVHDFVSDTGRRDGVALARGQYYDLLQHLCFDEPTVGALEETLRLCRSKRVPVVMLLMPEGTQFRSWYPPTVDEQITARLGEFGRRYDVGVLDARYWLADDAFSDDHHLLPAAAERFSERLAREIGPRLSAANPVRSERR